MLEITTNPLLHRIYFSTIIQIQSNTSLSRSGCTKKKITSKTSNFEVGQGELKGNKKNTSFAECYVHLFSINMNGINDFELYEAYLISVYFSTTSPTISRRHPTLNKPPQWHWITSQLNNLLPLLKKNRILQGWWADRFILYPHSYA